jgi:hypothetical protein
MGYDMYWVKKDSEDEAAYQKAHDAFYSAVQTRDAIPKYQEALRQEAQKVVEERSAAMYKAQRYYFRANIWGMQRLRDIMWRAEMIHDVASDARPDHPRPEEFGLDDDVAWNMHDQHTYYAPKGEAEPVTDERYHKWRAAYDNWLTWAPEVPGMPIWKFGSNDGWVVTPIEILGALHKWGENGNPTPSSLGLDTGDEPGWDEWWALWIQYLIDAAQHDGFEVH